MYGGSDLLVARGGFEALLALGLGEDARLAVARARAYDAAAAGCFPGMFASRRNYDVIQGLDAAGRRRSGVLEQSWRVGGASGTAPPPPPRATVYFHGVDERVGPITKYATVEPAE